MTTDPKWLHPHWPTELSAPRLWLRPVETADAQLLRTLWTDPEVRRFLGGPVAADQLDGRLADAASQRGHFTVVLTEVGQAVGTVTLDPDHRAAGRPKSRTSSSPPTQAAGMRQRQLEPRSAGALRWHRTIS